MKRFAAAGTLALALIAGPVLADIYAYTDDAGITHYSNVPADGQYKLIIATPREPAAPGHGRNLLARSAKYDSIIENAAKASAVESALLRAVIAVESDFDSRAVSRRGAVGLMQLMPQTSKRYGVEDPFDPTENVNAGAKYLGELIRRYDQDLELVLAAYNAGEAAVERSGRRIPAFRETTLYVPQVLKVYRMFRDQKTVT